MHTSDESASGEGPGRSSSLEPAAEDVAAPVSDGKPVCGFPLAKMNKSGTFTCRNPPVDDGERCRLHVGLTPDPEAIELERLRLLQEAAERHAFAADRAIGVGENGDKDLAFNRNARTAATLLRTRRALARVKPEGDPEEKADIAITDNGRSPAADAAPATAAATAPETQAKDDAKD